MRRLRFAEILLAGAVLTSCVPRATAEHRHAGAGDAPRADGGATQQGAAGADAPADLSPDGTPLRLVLALDGIPFDLFHAAQVRGFFAGFKPAARMVSTFPSLSDVAFSAIGGSEPPDGYQAMRFDPASGHVVGNTLHSLSGEAHQHMPADTPQHTAWHRMLGYVASYHLALKDVDHVGDAVLASHKETFVAYVEETDMLMHVEGPEQGTKFLERLDATLASLQAAVREKTGRDLAIDIVSDHGSTMCHGQVVPVERLLEQCGYRRAKQLDEDSDVAYSLAGIIASVAISCAPEETERVATCLAPDDGVDVVAFQRGDAVVVLQGGGEAEIRLRSASPEVYSVRILRGDPLGLGVLGSLSARAERPAEITLDEPTAFAATADALRPDPLRRIWRAFHGAVKTPSDVLVSLADGSEAGNRTVRALARMRGRWGTHGSLTRLASLGVLASNWREVPDADAWTAHDVLFSDATRRDLARHADRQRSAE